MRAMQCTEEKGAGLRIGPDNGEQEDAEHVHLLVYKLLHYRLF